MESVWRRLTPFDSQVRSDGMVSRRHTGQTRPGPALIMILLNLTSALEYWPDPILSRENCCQSCIVQSQLPYNTHALQVEKSDIYLRVSSTTQTKDPRCKICDHSLEFYEKKDSPNIH
eukprot:sb/3476440/